MIEIIKASNEFLKTFFYPLPNTILFDNKANYYSLIVDGIPVCMAGIKGNRIKTCYTPILYRGKGYFTKLLKYLIKDKESVEALCTKDSVNIFAKCGFKIIKIYNKQNKKGEKYTLWLCRFKR